MIPAAGVSGEAMAFSTYFGLFAAAFGAATLLPLQSEALLVGLMAYGEYPPWALITVATAGNAFGSAVNWLLGRYIERWRGKRWFPVSNKQLQRAERSYHRYGRWSLLLSWVPIIGDPLTVVAGILREPFWSFMAIVLLAKLGRYLFLAAVTLGVMA